MTPDPDASASAHAAKGFDAWFEQFLAAVLARHPVDATFFGAPGYDHPLPDYSHAADADWIARAEALIRALDTLPADALPKAKLYDRILARSALQLWLHETRSPCFQSGNPAFHVGEAIAGVVALLPEDTPTNRDQIELVIARLHATPSFLETARSRIRSAPLVWTELAMRQCDACAAYLSSEPLEQLAATGHNQRALADALTVATDAYMAHATWLRSELAEKRLEFQPAGIAALDAYLHLGHLLPASQTPRWWFEYAHAELIEATAELRALAKAIDWKVPVSTLLRQMATDHRGADGYDAAFPAAWEHCRKIAEQFELVSWPDTPVRFQAISPDAEVLWSTIGFPHYRAKPPLTENGIAEAFYPALDRSLPLEEQERLLRRYNHSEVLLEAITRNAGLGRHVQQAHARNAPTTIGRLAGTIGGTRRLFFCGNAISDGWACYAGELLEESGTLSPLQQLAEARRRLWVAAHAVGDIGMHTGELSLARVAHMYRDEVGMPASQAMEQAVRDSMHPGAGMAELAGTAGIDELRRAIEDRDGVAFDLKGFHDRLLSHGAIPITLIAASMLDISDA